VLPVLQEELAGAILHPSLLIDQLGIVLIPPQNKEKHWTVPESVDLMVLPNHPPEGNAWMKQSLVLLE
jgi:hypothetical protein